ncbi:hypothetical protein F5J12DRAFT_728914, partial [Pisolithus orientalis]|uniref:uncharacterized protein n=1 Tax=Pisolithus orientalis TaxID=936130 RepID=UPI0022249E8A
VAGIVFPVVATVVTCFRLFVRVRQSRFWLDDTWAALAMVFNIIFLVVNWLYLHDYGAGNGFRSSRISILFTVVRLTFPGLVRRLLVLIAIAFMVAWMILGAQIFWTCETEPGWKTQPRPQCDLGRNVAITQIITDVLGDMILIIAPVRLIYKVKLTKAQKIRLLSIFSTSAGTTVVSIAHGYYVYSGGGLREVLAAIAEFSVSLIVANLSVVVAFFFHISTEETATPAPLELKSIITFGSLPTRKRIQRDPLSTLTVVDGIETSTIEVDDLPTTPKKVAEGGGNDAEVVSFQTVTEPGLFYDA